MVPALTLRSNHLAACAKSLWFVVQQRFQGNLYDPPRQNLNVIASHSL
jgi:hypothetical protein